VVGYRNLRWGRAGNGEAKIENLVIRRDWTALFERGTAIRSAITGERDVEQTAGRLPSLGSTDLRAKGTGPHPTP
jgi:hypothetical protein